MATITARISDQDKTEFEAFCASVGLNTSVAVNLYVKAVLRGKRIPFEIVSPQEPVPSAECSAKAAPAREA
jgi:DNA-damage-inducible protein J